MEPWEISPQDEIRLALKEAGITRKQLADELEVPKRTIDAWLLPSASKGFRKIAKEDLQKILTLARVRSESDETFRVGLYDPRVPQVVDNIFGIKFPTIFRHTITNKDGSGQPFIEYSFRPELDWGNAQPTRKQNCISEPVTRIAAEDVPWLDELTWMFIHQHKSSDEMDGYSDAIFYTQSEEVCTSVDGCLYEGRYFTLHIAYKPRGANLDVVTKYSTTMYKQTNVRDDGQLVSTENSGWRCYTADGKEIHPIEAWRQQ